MKKYDWKLILKFIPLIGLFLFAYMVYNIGIGNIINAFSIIPIHFYAIACLLLIPRTLLSTYKWQYICKKQKMDFEFFYLADALPSQEKRNTPTSAAYMVEIQSKLN